MVSLDLLVRRVLGGAELMNGHGWFAFVVTPAVVVLMGYVAVRLHEWDLARDRGPSCRKPI